MSSYPKTKIQNLHKSLQRRSCGFIHRSISSQMCLHSWDLIMTTSVTQTNKRTQRDYTLGFNDATGFQKAIAKKIFPKEAGYVLAAKGSQGHLSSAIQGFLTSSMKRISKKLGINFQKKEIKRMIE